MTRILLIDNDVARRALMAGELREHGFDVAEHEQLNIESLNGAEAIAAEGEARQPWQRAVAYQQREHRRAVAVNIAGLPFLHPLNIERRGESSYDASRQATRALLRRPPAPGPIAPAHPRALSTTIRQTIPAAVPWAMIS